MKKFSLFTAALTLGLSSILIAHADETKHDDFPSAAPAMSSAQPASETLPTHSEDKDPSGVSVRKAHDEFGEFPKVHHNQKARKECNAYCKNYVKNHFAALSAPEMKDKRRECEKACRAFNREHGNVNAPVYRKRASRNSRG